MSLPYKQANAILARDVLGFCKKYLPGGAVKGDWWLVCCPWRADKNPSLGVNLRTGRWSDFGRPGERGDLLDIQARIEKRASADIVRELTANA